MHLLGGFRIWRDMHLGWKNLHPKDPKLKGPLIWSERVCEWVYYSQTKCILVPRKKTVWHKIHLSGTVQSGTTFSLQGSPVLFLWNFLPCFHSSSWTHNIWTLFSFQFRIFKTMITLFSFQFTMSETIFCIKGPNIFTWDPRLSDILTIPTIWSVTML